MYALRSTMYVLVCGMDKQPDHALVQTHTHLLTHKPKQQTESEAKMKYQLIIRKHDYGAYRRSKINAFHVVCGID